jgi:hypothetical protein
MFIISLCLDSESSKSLIETISDNTETNDMDHNRHDRTTHHTSFSNRFWNFSSSPSTSIMSPRFIGLCFLVFVYYIGYGYLQVYSYLK